MLSELNYSNFKHNYNFLAHLTLIIFSFFMLFFFCFTHEKFITSFIKQTRILTFVNKVRNRFQKTLVLSNLYTPGLLKVIL